MSKNLLVATDFSSIARNAVSYTLAAAKDAKAKVILFHLYRISSHQAHAMVSAKDYEEMIIRKRQSLKEYGEQVGAKYGVEVETIFKVGDFLEEINLVIEEYKPVMLILGMPKKSYEQELLGNTTTSAIYNLKFPVLAIPETATYTGFKHILYACDLNRGVHAKVLERVRVAAKIFNAVVEVLFIGDKVKEIGTKQQVETALDGLQYYFKNVPSDNIIKGIMAEANEVNADLIIMTPHKHGFWSSLIHRSKTRAMASNGTIPLLSISY